MGDSSVLFPNGRAILEQRYYGPSDQSPEDIFRRVASFVASAEETQERQHWMAEFYEAMSSLELLPNSPCLKNAGVDQYGALSACYVVPIDDMMIGDSQGTTGICDAATAAILIQKAGGGVGYSGARLRPKGTVVRSAHGTAMGPVGVLRYLNAASDMVTQASFRRGANMFILPCWSPDIMEFINCKTEDPERLSCFNISVAVTDEFMEAYRNDSDYALYDPRDRQHPVAHLRAREVMQKMAVAAWTTGDPGVFNLDLANRINPCSHKQRVECTNPCSEQVLPPWGSCTLASIDISKFVTDQGAFDVPSFRQTTKLGVRFLDDVVTVNQHPLPQIQQQAENDRRIGLGLMGWHDFLILQGIPYGNEAGVAAAQHVGAIFQSAADEASEELAEERGAYPWFKGSPRHLAGKKPIRNATRTCMAPTGTISIIAGCSSGIEPRFGLANWRKYYDPAAEEFKTFAEPEVSRAFEAVAKANGFWSAELIKLLADGASLRQAYSRTKGAPLPPDAAELLATAGEISPEWHIQMQAAWQRHLCNAISKTTNLPAEAAPEDVEKAFIMALDAGCVSTTIYRDGSRQNQILTNGRSPASRPDLPEASQTPSEGQERLVRVLTAVPHGAGPRVPVAAALNGRRRLPNERNSITHKIQVADWDGYVTVGLYTDGLPGEIFMASKEGSTVGGLLDAWATSISIGLQHGVPLETLTKKMRSTHFEPSGLTPNPNIRTATSIVDYVGHWLEQKFLNGHLPEPEPTGMICSDCGGRMIIQMGCHVCEQCGNEKCG